MRTRFALATTLLLGGCLNMLPPAGDAPDGGAAADMAMDVPPGTSPPPPSQPPPPAVSQWVRGSLAAPYQLTPRGEYGRIVQAGISMQDADFQSNATTTSAAAKMDELASQITTERGLPNPLNLIPDAADRQRSQLIPFRGNPSDVKFITVNGATEVFVPLGGDVMTPGNEVAVVSAGNFSLTTRVKVGVRPQHLAVHPAGLVFVCNQYSNYISIIDPVSNQLLRKAGQPVEVKTEYYCSDLLFVPINPAANDPDHQYLYVANRWRHSVLKYRIDVIRDPLSNRPVDITQTLDPKASPANKPIIEILDVGANPFRLGLSDQKNAIFVANNKGGELSRIDLGKDKVTQRISLNAPSADVVSIQDLVFVPTTMPDRGLLSRDQLVPQQVQMAPITVQGIDGKSHVAHPGALFDSTRSYNFEDMRNGLFQIDSLLTQQAVYFTDDVSSEPNFVQQQKVLVGALPTTLVRDTAGTHIYVALGGSDVVQRLDVNTASRPFTVTASGRSFKTQHRPFGLALNEAAGQLYVADWGSEVLEVFDAASGNRLASVDLGYAQPAYPATNIEKGEFFYYNAAWSNNGRKACATCHFDELDTDGVGYSNGAEAPTGMHQVKPNHNLATTDSYFWNGSFGDGNYTSLAFFAQTRTNCENVEFGLIEGPASDPGGRLGDPRNFTANAANDAKCRPQSNGPSSLANQAQIDQIDAQEKALAHQKIQQATGLDFQALSRVLDFYSVAELRLPPNPQRYLYGANQLDPSVKTQIDQGKVLFQSSGCNTCHDPSNTRHPFADGLDHGAGADWTSRFVNIYANDPRILNTIGGFSQTTLDAISPALPDHEVNMYPSPIEYFIPFCFDANNCLQFDDPLAVRGNVTEETRRLNLLITVNLLDPDRQFIPGNVLGQAKINTPSLRGVWTQANLLHNGLGHTLHEVILGPGHPALQPGESGMAMDVLGNLDVHGTTKALSASDVDALVRYVLNIE